MRSDDFRTIIRARGAHAMRVSRKHSGKCGPMFFGYYQSSRSSICVSRKHPGNCDPMIFGSIIIELEELNSCFEETPWQMWSDDFRILWELEELNMCFEETLASCHGSFIHRCRGARFSFFRFRQSRNLNASYVVFSFYLHIVWFYCWNTQESIEWLWYWSASSDAEPHLNIWSLASM